MLPDPLDPARCSAHRAKIRRADTKPERVVRRLCHFTQATSRLGAQYDHGERLQRQAQGLMVGDDMLSQRHGRQARVGLSAQFAGVGGGELVQGALSGRRRTAHRA
jgi:hypothetical protein